MLDEYIELIKENPIKFGLVSGFADLREIHNGWIKSFLFEKNDLTLLAHRWQL